MLCGSWLAIDVFEGRIHLMCRLKVRVPLTLLDSPAMFYCRFVDIYTIRNAFNSSFQKLDDNYFRDAYSVQQ